MMSFQKRLGICSLHAVHTASTNGLKELSFDLDLFFEDICFFFKRSSAQREDYTSLKSITNVTACYAMRHATRRWLSMKYVAVIIYEQFDNLKEYFLTFLPKQKREYYLVKKIYQRVVKALRDNLTISYISFCAFASDHFEAFLLLCQYDSFKMIPIIHMYYPGLIKLLLGIFI